MFTYDSTLGFPGGFRGYQKMKNGRILKLMVSNYLELFEKHAYILLSFHNLLLEDVLTV